MRRRRLLAGSTGPERVPASRRGDDPRWFEPLHVRDEEGARERIAAQVAAGADLVVAPTWLTHRKALLPLGETRRARAWTAAAVRVARDGVELGLERRETLVREEREGGFAEQGSALADRSPHPGQGEESGGLRAVRPDVPRPAPLVAASLPALDEVPEAGSGRLLPREAATARDYRDQAGLLADAQADILLVEGQGTLAEARVAVEESVATGSPVWSAASVRAASGSGDAEWLERWVETCRQLGAEVLLLPPPAPRSAGIVLEGAIKDGEWGGLLTSAGGPEQARAWLESDAMIIGLLDGASPNALAGPRAEIDARERVELEAEAEAEARWLAHVDQAAAMAPGGAAAWVGGDPPTLLPHGFDWALVQSEERRRLPAARYRLVVDASGTEADPGAVARALEPGGILATAASTPIRVPDGLRLVALDDRVEPALLLLRRET